MATRPAPAADVECLYTTMRNISGQTLFFGFIPPHGKSMADDEEVSFWGDIYERMTKLTPNDRAEKSLEYALTNCLIEIVKGPAVHLYDTTLATTQILDLDNDTLAAIDPCWACAASPSPSPSP